MVFYWRSKLVISNNVRGTCKASPVEFRHQAGTWLTWDRRRDGQADRTETEWTPLMECAGTCVGWVQLFEEYWPPTLHLLPFHCCCSVSPPFLPSPIVTGSHSFWRSKVPVSSQKLGAGERHHNACTAGVWLRVHTWQNDFHEFCGEQPRWK